MKPPPEQPGRVALARAAETAARELAGVPPEALDGRRVRFVSGGVVFTLSARAVEPEPEPEPDGPPPLPAAARKTLRLVYAAVWRLRKAPGGGGRKVWPADVADEIERVHGKKARPADSTVYHALKELVDGYDVLRRVNGYDLPEHGLF